MLRLKFFESSTFSKNLVTPLGMSVGDDLVTIQVLEHPMAPTQWLLGLWSPGHGSPKSPEAPSLPPSLLLSQIPRPCAKAPSLHPTISRLSSRCLAEGNIGWWSLKQAHQ